MRKAFTAYTNTSAQSTIRQFAEAGGVSVDRYRGLLQDRGNRGNNGRFARPATAQGRIGQ